MTIITHEKPHVCVAYFTAAKAFEIHRVGPPGDRSCLGPCAVENRGLSIGSGG